MDMLPRYPLTRRKDRCIHSYSSQGSDPIYFAQSPCLIPDGRTSFEAARVAENPASKNVDRTRIEAVLRTRIRSPSKINDDEIIKVVEDQQLHFSI
jgi:hypothetical protein